jgi:hypothetical protein
MDLKHNVLGSIMSVSTSRAGLEVSMEASIGGNPSEQIAFDKRLSSEAVRLYQILVTGKSLDEAADVMGLTRRSLLRHERILRRTNYMRLSTEYDADGKRRRVYIFSADVAPEGSRLAS